MEALKNDVLTVAFYLPQFHEIPENNEWWGQGFTEWTNVRKAEKLFDQHDQPRMPTDLGYYDLVHESPIHKQAEMARLHDIDAFCFYFYWFAGKRLLERPLDAYLKNGPEHPFCISWANENWSRRWDGKDHEVLIAQDYGDSTAESIFKDFLPLLRDRRYLRVDGAALLLVHRVDHLPDARDYARVWRNLAAEHGVGPLRLVAAETTPDIDPRVYGFDAVSEFPPVGSGTFGAAHLAPLAGMDPSFRGRILSYSRLSRRFQRRRNPDFTRYRGVIPGWDNSARRRQNSTIFFGSSPAAYQRWLAWARAEEAKRTSQGVVFVNAWNEWAEGAYLEPDASFGNQYLLASKAEVPTGALQEAQPARLGLSVGWIRSMLTIAAATLIGTGRKVRNRLQSYRNERV
ncbi:Glycosyltransferase WbsX [Arthrobacter subterraneus]|uniref:Glycosyltransferase WbsX n=1 Tax=Arthrobacter subterraneus TaxID=335973 RepID=A0A1G8J4T8_9MICC|nr:glycoside hydrolase family 99-like domain-containing protein [Arthrobacter subterraneus]SDI26236.1 Glycosyltransferase WbsX [Arthrobacter subterraneus]